ncbi:MAG: TolC family protein, partial [Holophagales bacterium]|nr:TolC family protein [Holophagales bacterium]
MLKTCERTRSTIARHPRSSIRFGLLLGLALAGVGCTGSAGPLDLDVRPSLPTEIPGSWRELEAAGHGAHPSAPDDAQLAVWWRQLGDPVLDQLVESAIVGSLDLQTAAARVAEARAQRGLSRAELGPSVSAGLDGRAAEPLADGLSSESYTGSLTASWEADLFGSKRSALAASNAELAASEQQLDDARISLVAEVVVAYADLRVAEARLRVIEESLESRDQTYQLTDFRERAGLASRLELDQALSSREQTRASLSTVEQSATGARLRLALLAGQPPGSLDGLLDGAPPGGGSEVEASSVPTLPEAIA